MAFVTLSEARQCMFISNVIHTSYLLIVPHLHLLLQKHDSRRGAQKSYTDEDIRAALQAAKADESRSMASLRTSDTPPKHAFTNPFLYYVLRQLIELIGE